MKRVHLHITVDDLDASIRFYETLFGEAPTVRKPDYAKFMLEDPRVNLALGQRSTRPGIDHVGIQVDDDTELSEVYGRLNNAGAAMIDEGEVDCCYAHSEKAWVSDPSGVSWEVFRSMGAVANYGDGIHQKTPPAAAPASVPSTTTTAPRQTLPEHPACC